MEWRCRGDCSQEFRPFLLGKKNLQAGLLSFVGGCRDQNGAERLDDEEERLTQGCYQLHSIDFKRAMTRRLGFGLKRLIWPLLGWVHIITATMS